MLQYCKDTSVDCSAQTLYVLYNAEYFVHCTMCYTTVETKGSASEDASNAKGRFKKKKPLNP